MNIEPIMIKLDDMSEYYLDCLWKENIRETIFNDIKNKDDILHQHNINIMSISLAFKFKIDSDYPEPFELPYPPASWLKHNDTLLTIFK